MVSPEHAQRWYYRMLSALNDVVIDADIVDSVEDRKPLIDHIQGLIVGIRDDRIKDVRK